MHHEFAASTGFAAPYVHGAEILILAIPLFLGPAIVPGHMVTFWIWIVSGRLNPSKHTAGMSIILSYDILTNAACLMVSCTHMRIECVNYSQLVL